MENNNEKKEKKVIEISVSSLILSIILILIVILAINMYLYSKGKPNLYSTMKELFAADNQVENEIDENNTNSNDEETGKTYRTFGEDGIATVKLYEDNTLTITWKSFDMFREDGIFGGDGFVVNTEENIEHKVSKINGEITNVYVYGMLHSGQPLPYILISVLNEKGVQELRYINTIKAMEQDKYIIENIEGLPQNFSREYIIFDPSNPSDFSHKLIALCWNESEIGEIKYRIVPDFEGKLHAEKYVETEKQESKPTTTPFQGGVYNLTDGTGEIISQISFYEYGKFDISNTNREKTVKWPIEGEYVYDKETGEIECTINKIYFASGEIALKNADIGMTFKGDITKIELIDRTSNPTIDGIEIKIFPETGTVYKKGQM